MPDVLLPIYLDGRHAGDEAVPAEPAGAGRFRVRHSPGMVEGLAAGDEFALDDAAPTGYRVVRRGGNLCVWFFFAGDVHAHAPEVADLRGLVGQVGGWVDGGYGPQVVLTVPVAAGFPAVEGALDAAVRRHPGARWLYGNVYDPADGETPLGWWR